VDRQCIEGFLRRGVPAGYHRVDEPTAAQLVEDFDDQLYHVVQHVSGHILQPLLPNHRSNSYVLRDRRHDIVLPCRLNSLTPILLLGNFLKNLSMYFKLSQYV